MPVGPSCNSTAGCRKMRRVGTTELTRVAIDDGCVTCPWRGVSGHRFRLGPLPPVGFDPASGDAALYW